MIFTKKIDALNSCVKSIIFKNTIKILCWAEILAVTHCTSNRLHRFSTDMLVNTLIKLQQEPSGETNQHRFAILSKLFGFQQQNYITVEHFQVSILKMLSP